MALKCSGEDNYGPRYTSSEGSETCDKCTKGYFRMGEDCHNCPEGADCERVGSTLENMHIVQGYYR